MWRKCAGGRPLTLQHGDLHPANLTMRAKSNESGKQPTRAERLNSFALFDWAEVNLGSGPEELAHLLLRCRIWVPAEGDGGAESGGQGSGSGPRLCAPKEAARPLLDRYYRVLTRNGVNAADYPYEAMKEHVCLGLLTSAAKLVDRLDQMRAAHPLGPEPFGAPRWLL